MIELKEDQKGKLPDEQKEALTSLGIRVNLIDRKKDKEIAKKKLKDAVKLYEEYEKLGNDQDKDS